ncbi:MAG: dockerin type I repeat-containing protein [Phycisphaerae bacterium]|nr:dockerin type I repeat-containing protein [Phycisphaerae bacterium]
MFANATWRRSARIASAFGVSVAGVASINAAGPDIICSRIQNISSWNSSPTGPRVFSFGGDICNIGDVNAVVNFSNNQHPVSGQALYRVAGDGRFEQLGTSWLFHQFCVLQLNGCGTCAPAGAGCLSQLGLNCSSNDTSGAMGGQSNLGPRFEVNPSTGQFSFPFTAQGQSGSNDYKRLQVSADDLNPALNAGARYLAETQFISPDDALAGNGFNNASSREMLVMGIAPTWNLQQTGSTFVTESAIERWPTMTPGAVVVDVMVPGDGLFHAGAYVRDNGDQTWTYNYAVHNLNSDRAAYAFSVEVPTNTEITNVSFRDVDYHSGEPFTNVDWTPSNVGESFGWTADATFAENPNANALRWGTTYSFRFVADAPPTSGTATIELFKPGGVGAPASVIANLPVPSNPLVLGDMNCDGIVSVGDISGFVLALTDPTGYAAAFPGCSILAADVNADGVISVGDIAGFVALLTQ